MRIRKPGKIKERVWFLGSEETCIYLLEGKRDSMIINGGMGYILPDVLRQLEMFEIEKDRIMKLLILHTHFDHVGIVPFLKRHYPQMEILTSSRGWDILQSPKALSTINDINLNMARMLGKDDVYDRYDVIWRDDIKGSTVSEGDCIELGDLEIHIYETPGHSTCSISAHVPELGLLFPSDAGGVPYKEKIISLGSSNFTEYQQSLEKLKGLEVQLLLADHYGYVAGEEAGEFIQRSIDQAKQDRLLMEEFYRRTGDVGSAARELRIFFYKENPEYPFPPEILEGLFRRMVEHVISART